QVKLDVLRAMKSALKYKFVEKEQKDLTDDEALLVFQTLIKQRKDAADQATQYNRPEAAQKELREIDIINTYMPKALSEDELKTMIAEAIKVSQSSTVKDLGKVMKELKAKIVGRADAKLVTDLVRQQLAP
ncbi:MAG: uncharacterized protein JWQ35_497, partial [Bacteriovoracaceae bacterium]|nr:uncharacterized protein [Bacteriovoracaceae bacterium]